MSFWEKLTPPKVRKWNEASEYAWVCLLKMANFLGDHKREKTAGGYIPPWKFQLVATEEEYENFISTSKELEHCIQIMKDNFEPPTICYSERDVTYWNNVKNNTKFLIQQYVNMIKKFNSAEKFLKNK